MASYGDVNMGSNAAVWPPQLNDLIMEAEFGATKSTNPKVMAEL